VVRVIVGDTLGVRGGAEPHDAQHLVVRLQPRHHRRRERAKRLGLHGRQPGPAAAPSRRDAELFAGEPDSKSDRSQEPVRDLRLSLRVRARMGGTEKGDEQEGAFERDHSSKEGLSSPPVKARAGRHTVTAPPAPPFHQRPIRENRPSHRYAARSLSASRAATARPSAFASARTSTLTSTGWRGSFGGPPSPRSRSSDASACGCEANGRQERAEAQPSRGS